MRILYLEPYYGGSHRAIADALSEHSGNDVDLLTMPARHWKWRLRGSAFHFVGQIHDLERSGRGYWDLVFCSSLLDVSLLRSLWSRVAIPIVQYFHEHQFTYPTRSGLTPDSNYPLTDLASALSADKVLFNSEYCRSTFLDGARTLLSRMPDYRCSSMVAGVEDKSEVLYPGTTSTVVATDTRNNATARAVPRILWNHRWEHDKDPESFFSALERLDRSGGEWELVVTGGRYRGTPTVFDGARDKFSHRIVHWGYVPDGCEYARLIASCDIVVSTARQENFGLSVLEALRNGLRPVLPRRLVYPELYGNADVLFFDEDERLSEVLWTAIHDMSGLSGARRLQRRQWASQFDWSSRIHAWDEMLARFAV